MELCVGAASRRVVEEAAKLHVHQVVASRRQVHEPTGYIGLSPRQLVDLVDTLSYGNTRVVRDHGGPNQGGFDDDGVDALQVDVDAGFHALHIDVCNEPAAQQRGLLRELCVRFNDTTPQGLEVGGEHERPTWNTRLLRAVLDAGIKPAYVVAGLGTRVWNDLQVGYVHDDDNVRAAVNFAHENGVKVKAHNMDWIPDRRLKLARMEVDAYNLAPELGQVEIRAILKSVPADVAEALLAHAYASRAWRRWFGLGEGTMNARAECALRYLLENDVNARATLAMVWTDDNESYVRGCIRDAIVNG